MKTSKHNDITLIKVDKPDYFVKIAAKFRLLGALLPILCISAGFGQEFEIPENPLQGRFVFDQKGCIICHSVGGEGGEIGPDLGKEKYYGTFLEFASVMWNHVPEMLRQMRELNLPFPKFSKNEIVEMTAYLYYLRYLGEPGNLYRGKILINEKGCLSCHSIGGKGKHDAPAFDELSKFISPLYLAQSLWNHGPEMGSKLEKMGQRYPKFEKGEIGDLSAYIRAASTGSESEQVYLSPGNPQRGRKIYDQKNCSSCHSSKANGKIIAADLATLDWGYSVTEIAGVMWNHGADMREFMIDYNIEWPKFEGQEMADLIAYLYFIKFTDPPGDSEIGKRLFAEKGCATCHEKIGKDAMGIPDLTKSTSLSSSSKMIQIMLNHAPVMEEKILEKNLTWPEFTPVEMTHLYAFLSSIIKKPKSK